MFVFPKPWHALFSCSTRFEIGLFSLLATTWEISRFKKLNISLGNNKDHQKQELLLFYTHSTSNSEASNLRYLKKRVLIYSG